MRTMLLIVIATGLLVATGCQKQAEPVAQVPPPSGDVEGEAVYVGPETEPPVTVIGADPSTSASSPSSSGSVTYQMPTRRGSGASSGSGGASSGQGGYQPSSNYQSSSQQPQSYRGSQGQGGSVHVVQRGDTLWSIAVRYYGDGQRWKDIARANGIGNEHRLRIGQRLQLP